MAAIGALTQRAQRKGKEGAEKGWNGM